MVNEYRVADGESDCQATRYIKISANVETNTEEINQKLTNNTLGHGAIGLLVIP